VEQLKKNAAASSGASRSRHSGAKASEPGRAFEELRLSLTEEDLEEALKSSEEFRKSFKLK